MVDITADRNFLPFLKKKNDNSSDKNDKKVFLQFAKITNKMVSDFKKSLVKNSVVKKNKSKNTFSNSIIKQAESQSHQSGVAVGAFLSKEQRKFETLRFAKQLKEDKILQKMRRNIEVNRIKGDKKNQFRLTRMLNSRIRKNEKLEEQEELLAELRSKSFLDLSKTALGPFGAALGGFGDTLSSLKTQFMAIKEVGSRLADGFKNSISAVTGIFKSKKEKSKEDATEDVVMGVDKTNNILVKISDRISSFFDLNKRNNREKIAEKNKLGKPEETSKIKKTDDDKGLFGGITSRLNKLTTKIVAGLVGTVTAFFGGLGRSLLRIIPKILGKLALPVLIITSLISLVKGMFDSFNESKSDSLIGKIGDAVIGGLANLLSFFTFGFISKDTIVDTINSMITIVSDWFTEKIGQFQNLFGTFWTGLQDKISKVKDIIFGTIEKVIRFVSNTMIKLINGVMEIYAKIFSTIGLDSIAKGIRNHKIALLEAPTDTDKKLEKLQTNKSALSDVKNGNTTVAINAPSSSTNISNNSSNNLPPPMVNTHRLSVAASALF